MAPACASSRGSLAVRLHVWYCPPSPRPWQANSNPYTSTWHQTPQIDAAHWCAVRQTRRRSDPPSAYKDWLVQCTKWQQHVYTYMLRPIAQSGAEKFCDFFFFLNVPSFLLHLPFFLCAVSVLAPLTRHEQTGAPRVQRWPKLKSVTSSITSCHPSTPPSALSFLHWRTRPSLFRSEWVVHVLFNIMRTRLPPHPSVLHQVWQQLLKMVMVEQEGAHQQQMKKRGETSTDGIERKVLCFYQEKPSATSLGNKEWRLIFLFNISLKIITNNVVFSHKVWKLLELLSKVNCLEKELLQKRTRHR